LVMLLLGLRDEQGQVEPMDTPLPKLPLVWAVLAVVFLTGLAPYLGLRTRASFTMFSNLRTENGASNHRFMPQLYVVDHQLDLVEVVETDHTWFNKAMAEGERLPWWEFLYQVSEEPEAHITYRRGGEEFTVARVGDDPVLADGVPWSQRRLLYYRPVGEGPATCQW